MKKFNFALHNIRGIAILLIVLLHTFQPITHDIYLWKLNEDWKIILLKSASAIFAFVAGYLSFFIEIPKFKTIPFKIWYGQYLKKKLKVVYLPMLIISLFIFFIASTTGYALNTVPACENLTKLIYVTLLGGMQTPYWYIPFTMVMFALTPLFFFCTLNRFLAIISTLFICILPLYFCRSNGHYYNGLIGFTNLIQDILYFGPMFFLGCIFCKFEETLKKILDNNFVKLILYLSLLIIIYLLYKNITNKENLYLETYQLVYIRNVLYCFVLLSVFFNFEKKIPVLDTLASFAFTIYFFHIFVFTGVNRLVQLSATFWSFGNYNAIGSYALGLFCVFITITLIVILGKFLKLLLGNYSRNVIGC